MSRRAFLTERIAGGSARHPLLTLAAWLVVIVACAAVYLAWSGVLTTTDDFVNSPESKQVELLVAERLPGTAADTEVVVVTAPQDRAVDGSALKRRVAALADKIAAIGPSDVGGVRSAADGEGAAALVSDDGRSALILVTLAGAASDADAHIQSVYTWSATPTGAKATR